MKTQKEYINKPNNCPSCNSNEISSQIAENYDNQIQQIVECNNCDRKWYDIYELTSYELID